MSDQENPSSWDELAENLGADVTSAKLDRPTGQSSSSHPLRFERPEQLTDQPTHANWDVLADELGLPPDQLGPTHRDVPAKSSASVVAVAEAVEIEQDQSTEADNATDFALSTQQREESVDDDFADPLAALESGGQLWDFTEPAMEVPEASSEQDIEVESPNEEDDASDLDDKARTRKRGRRRRRRGRRGDQVDRSTDTTSDDDAGEIAERRREEDGHTADAAHSSVEEAASSAEIESPYDELIDTERATEFIDVELDDDVPARDRSKRESTSDDLTRKEAARGGARRAGHKNIPAWSEAISVLVDKNVAARGGRRRQSSGGQRGRRGRRDR